MDEWIVSQGGWPDCQVWAGERKHDGTPVWRGPDGRGQPQDVRLLAYAAQIGPVPPGLDPAAGGCPTAWCVNPWHLKGGAG